MFYDESDSYEFQWSGNVRGEPNDFETIRQKWFGFYAVGLVRTLGLQEAPSSAQKSLTERVFSWAAADHELKQTLQFCKALTVVGIFRW